jgi:FdhE protein
MANPIGASSVAALSREHPEWRPWLSLLEETWRETRVPAWPEMLSGVVRDDGATRPSNAPLLAHTTIHLDPRPARDWARRLFGVGASGNAGTAAASAISVIFEAALCDDGKRLDALAGRLEMDIGRMRALAPLLVSPFLLACGQAWSVPTGWAQPYCPICGGWPTLAESRGLERARRLRCARDGSDWPGEWLRCVYCGTGEHSALESLASEDTRDPRRAETCTRCRGYLKTITTLIPATATDLAVADLATVELDVAATGHGYARPAGPAYDPAVEVVEGRRRALASWIT